MKTKPKVQKTEQPAREVEANRHYGSSTWTTRLFVGEKVKQTKTFESESAVKAWAEKVLKS